MEEAAVVSVVTRIASRTTYMGGEVVVNVGCSMNGKEITLDLQCDYLLCGLLKFYFCVGAVQRQLTMARAHLLWH